MSMPITVLKNIGLIYSTIRILVNRARLHWRTGGSYNKFGIIHEKL